MNKTNRHLHRGFFRWSVEVALWFYLVHRASGKKNLCSVQRRAHIQNIFGNLEKNIHEILENVHKNSNRSLNNEQNQPGLTIHRCFFRWSVAVVLLFYLVQRASGKRYFRVMCNTDPPKNWHNFLWLVFVSYMKITKYQIFFSIHSYVYSGTGVLLVMKNTATLGQHETQHSSV